MAFTLLVALSAKGQPEKPPGNADQTDRIMALVESLASPDFKTRRHATHELVALAPNAIPQLKLALESDDYEMRLRAQNLLTVIESILFNGVKITLSVTPEYAPWDTPRTLSITFENQADFETRIPVERFPKDDETDKIVRDFALTMDLAEYLTITGPGDREISLKTDDLTVDPRLEDALSRRVEGAVLSPLEAGKSWEVHVPAINRNTARYPMLREGAYKLQFDYVPQWDENELHTMKAGYAASNECVVHVTESAPTVVLEPGPEVGLLLSRDGDKLVAAIENRSDVPRAINLNLGRAAPFADVSWYVHLDDGKQELTSLAPPNAVDLKEFDPDRIRWIKPGETLKLTELPIDKLRPLIEGLQPNGPPVISVQYHSECGRRWQQSLEKPLPDGAPEVLTKPLPHRMVTTPLRSNPLKLTD